MLRIVLLRPGATDFDEQGRIKGSLDLPLSDVGREQVRELLDGVAEFSIDAIYTAPCQAARQTAEALGERVGVKVKSIEGLRNLDHGLWHGKEIEELRQTQPRVFRQWQEHPETVCPPEGEMLAKAQTRVRTALGKLLRKHKQGVVAIIAPEPLTSLLRNELDQSELGDLWKAGCRCGDWEVVELEGKRPRGLPAPAAGAPEPSQAALREAEQAETERQIPEQQMPERNGAEGSSPQIPRAETPGVQELPRMAGGTA